MSGKPPVLNWTTFWDLVTPEKAAALLREDYGAGADLAARRSRLAALVDGRPEDARFWDAVRDVLSPGRPRRRRPPPPAATRRR